MAKRKSKKASKEAVETKKTEVPARADKRTTILPLKSAKEISELKERVATLERLVQSVLDQVVGN